MRGNYLLWIGQENISYMILWDTWYADYKKKVKIKFLLMEKYSSTVDLTERILKVLHTALHSLHCEYQISKELSDLSIVFADCGIW
jgi:hypothetical protein